MIDGSTRVASEHGAAGERAPGSARSPRRARRRAAPRSSLRRARRSGGRAADRGTPRAGPAAAPADRDRRAAPAASTTIGDELRRCASSSATAARLRGTGTAGFSSTFSSVGCCLNRSANCASSLLDLLEVRLLLDGDVEQGARVADGGGFVRSLEFSPGSGELAKSFTSSPDLYHSNDDSATSRTQPSHARPSTSG